MDTINLQLFCADDDRLNLSKPFSRGEWTYATNDHIVVRVPRRDEVPELDNGYINSHAESLFLPAPDDGWMPVPAVSEDQAVEECKTCRGWQQHECSCGHVHKCPDCDVNGTVPCRERIPVGDAGYSTCYLFLVQGWEIRPNGEKAAWLRNGDAQGLLMPMRA